MPANLPPQYYEAKRRYELAKTNAERIAVLEEMLAIMPKHKGTDKLSADLRTRISKLKKEGEKKPAKSTHSYYIRKQGAAQIALIGMTNVGKSQLLASFTKATPEVAPYPFTTQEASVGMMPYENIQYQLVDTPPITPDYVKSWVFDLIKVADMVLLLIDLSSDDALDQIESVRKKLREHKIELVSKFSERLEQEQEQEEEEFDIPVLWQKKTIIVANKFDAEGAAERLKIIQELYGEEFEIVPISAQNGRGKEKIAEEVYKCLDIIRVYTKAPGKDADMSDPIVLNRGSTVTDAASKIHKDFAHNLKYARIWGLHRFNGQTVGKDEVLEEGDIVEFHI